jgi:HlyD family secretion protein
VQQIRLQPVINQNVVTYNVMIDAPNPDLKLLPGMTANVTIKVEEHTQVLAIPLAAIFFTPSDDYEKNNNNTEATIWVQCNDNGKDCIDFNGVKMSKLIIQKGIDNGVFVEISGNGVKEGMKIITGIKDVEINKKKDRDLIPDKDDKKGWK